MNNALHHLIATAACLAFIFSDTAFANDSTARVGAGSIVLLKNEQIRMVQEVLEISPKAIRVSYKFVNDAATDIRTTVAFPMPEYGWNPGESAFDANVGPLRSFKLFVDGSPVPTQLDRRAMFAGRDITKSLQKIGLDKTQILDTFGGCRTETGAIECDMTEQQQTQIAKMLGDGHFSTDWKVAETAYWEQTFPASKVLSIRHEYTPFTGMIYTYPHHKSDYSDDIPSPAILNDQSPPHDEACLDEGTRHALNSKIRSLIDAGTKIVWVELRDVEYILGTGRNWKGPIGDFKLRIEKTSPDQLVSLCFPGKPKRLSPLVFEFSHSNFVPQDRLVVHFYTVSSSAN